MTGGDGVGRRFLERRNQSMRPAHVCKPPGADRPTPGEAAHSLRAAPRPGMVKTLIYHIRPRAERKCGTGRAPPAGHTGNASATQPWRVGHNSATVQGYSAALGGSARRVQGGAGEGDDPGKIPDECAEQPRNQDPGDEERRPGTTESRSPSSRPRERSTCRG